MSEPKFIVSIKYQIHLTSLVRVPLKIASPKIITNTDQGQYYILFQTKTAQELHSLALHIPK